MENKSQKKMYHNILNLIITNLTYRMDIRYEYTQHYIIYNYILPIGCLKKKKIHDELRT